MIEIIYRLCEAETDGNIRNIRPPWFNKLNCLKSFVNDLKDTVEMVDRVVFVHDGEPGPQLAYLEAIEDEELRKKMHIDKINVKSNEGSYRKVLDIAEFSKSEVIYLVEDDYLHLPGSIRKVAQAATLYGVVTGYDHLNRYMPDFIGLNATDETFYHEVISFHKPTNRHWRTAESTCLTFAFTQIAKNSILIKAREHLLNDRAFWLSLIPLRIFTPIPALTTQVDQFQSPGIDWEQFNNSIK